jgi:hypothetical protein
MLNDFLSGAFAADLNELTVRPILAVHVTESIVLAALPGDGGAIVFEDINSYDWVVFKSQSAALAHIEKIKAEEEAEQKIAEDAAPDAAPEIDEEAA